MLCSRHSRCYLLAKGLSLKLGTRTKRGLVTLALKLVAEIKKECEAEMNLEDGLGNGVFSFSCACSSFGNNARNIQFTEAEV